MPEVFRSNDCFGSRGGGARERRGVAAGLGFVSEEWRGEEGCGGGGGGR